MLRKWLIVGRKGGTSLTPEKPTMEKSELLFPHPTNPPDLWEGEKERGIGDGVQSPMANNLTNNETAINFEQEHSRLVNTSTCWEGGAPDTMETEQKLLKTPRPMHLFIYLHPS